jgi:hypothetical protein
MVLAAISTSLARIAFLHHTGTKSRIPLVVPRHAAGQRPSHGPPQEARSLSHRTADVTLKLSSCNMTTLRDTPRHSLGGSAIFADQATENLPALDPGGDVDGVAGLT